MEEEEEMRELTLLQGQTEGAAAEGEELQPIVTAAQGRRTEEAAEGIVGTPTTARPVTGAQHQGPGRSG